MAKPITPGRFPIRIGGNPVLRMPVKTGMWSTDYNRWVTDTFFVGREQPHIKRALILLHGGSENRRADVYELRGKDAAEQAGKEQETLVIAPDLLREGELNTEYSSLLDLRHEPGLIHWKKGGMFSGSYSQLEAATPAESFSPLDAEQLGPISPRNGQVGILEVLNQIVSYLVKSGDFPSLRSIVIAGQSGGGNTVARYAALGLFDPAALPAGGDGASRTVVPRPNGSQVEVSYLVMSATFLYFDDRRFQLSTAAPNRRPLHRETEFTDAIGLTAYPSTFVIPSEGQLAWALQQEGSTRTVDWLRKRYNSYEYGTDGLVDEGTGDPHYASSFGALQARLNFAQRRVTILAGSKDFEPAVFPHRNLQGVNAAHRALLYREHLKEIGVWSDNRHTVKIIDGEGHNGRKLMLSQPGEAALFPSISQPAPGPLRPTPTVDEVPLQPRP